MCGCVYTSICFVLYNRLGPFGSLGSWVPTLHNVLEMIFACYHVMFAVLVGCRIARTHAIIQSIHTPFRILFFFCLPLLRPRAAFTAIDICTDFTSGGSGYANRRHRQAQSALFCSKMSLLLPTLVSATCLFFFFFSVFLLLFFAQLSTLEY